MTVLVAVSIVDANLAIVVRQILKSKQVVNPMEVTTVEACVVETFLVVSRGEGDALMRFEKKGSGLFFGSDAVKQMVENEDRTGGITVRRTLEICQLDQTFNDGLCCGDACLVKEIVRG